MVGFGGVASIPMVSTPRRRAVVLCTLVVGVSIAAGCSDGSPHAVQPRVTSQFLRARAAVGTTSESTTTSTPDTTTSVAIPEVPVTAPPAATPPVPGAPTLPPVVPPPPALEGDAAQPPPPQIVVPPAAFIGEGVPQPGSFFRSLLDDHSLDGKGKFVALTFDDGPGPYTRQIVDTLNLLGVKATFFQIANQSGGHADLVRYMASVGMHLGSHSRTHAHLPLTLPLQQWDEITGAANTEDAIVGPGTTKCFRPPYGQYDQPILDGIASRGLATAMWSVDTDDWMKPGVGTIVSRALAAAKDRSIILMHDGGGDRSETIQALPWIVVALQQQGFTLVPIC